MILLSAGHNPNAKGACNGPDFCEYPVASEWIDFIYEIMKPIYPVDIVPTGKLKQKVKYINRRADALIAFELHFNANVNARGVEALYHPASTKGKLLAEALCEGFEARGLFLPNRGAKIGYYQMNPLKPIDYFLRKTRHVSVIFEPEFISQKHRIIEHKTEACYAISDILLDFVEKQFGEQL